jgi:DNA-binding NtrC family response regulator
MTRRPAVPTPRATGPRSSGRLQRAIDAVVEKEIKAALRQTGGNVVQAARALGISQPGLYKRLTALRIDPSRFR